MSDNGSAYRKAGSLRALTLSGRMQTTIDGRSIALFHIDDGVVATQGKCPHARGPLHEGEVAAGKLICPWHGYTYDLGTGACEDDEDLTLARYEVRIEGDDIWVRI